MPSSEKFESGLNKWAGTDIIQRVDMTNDNQIIDAAIRHVPTPSEIGALPDTAKINDILLSSNPILDYSDVGSDPARLVFRNIILHNTDWSADVLFEGFGYRASIPLSGVLETMIPEVYFAFEEATSGEFASVAISFTGGLSLFRRNAPPEDEEITIPTIFFVR